ncbi:MAG: DUF4157 domain-containing protein [Candidatus Methylumidiphilus sp.]
MLPQSAKTGVGLNADVMAMQRMAGNSAVNHLVNSLGGGSPLPMELRGDMEQRFGEDFSQVRMHTDARAAESAEGFDAKAYTVGNNIVFNEGRFNPTVPEGKRLLAHELAHVVQQGRGGNVAPTSFGASVEQEAINASNEAVAGRNPIEISGKTGVGVACDQDEEVKAKRREERRFIDRMKKGDGNPTMKSGEGGSRNLEVKLDELTAQLEASEARKTPRERGRLNNNLGKTAEFNTAFALGEINQNMFPVAGPGTPVDVSRTTTVETDRGPREVKGGIDIYVHEWPNVIVGAVEQKFSDPSGNRPNEIFTKATAVSKSLIKNMEHAEKVFDAAQTGKDINGNSLGRDANGKPIDKPYIFPEGFRELHKAALKALIEKQDLPDGFLIIFTNTGGTQNKIGNDHVVRLLKEFEDPDYVQEILKKTVIIDTRPGNKGIKNALDNLTPEANKSLSEAKAAATKKKEKAEAKAAKKQKQEESAKQRAEAKAAKKQKQEEAAKQRADAAAAKKQKQEVTADTATAGKPPSPPKAVPAPKPQGAIAKFGQGESDHEGKATGEGSITTKEFADPAQVKNKNLPKSGQAEPPVNQDSTSDHPKVSHSALHLEKTIEDKVKVSSEELFFTSDDKRFRVTTTISLSAGASLGAERGSNGKASGTLGASGRLTLSFSRLMTEADKTNYIASVGGSAHGSSTELQIIELISSGNHGQAFEMLKNVRDDYISGANASKREEGQFIEIEADADITADIGASRGGTSVNVGVSVGKGVRRKIGIVDGKESISITAIDNAGKSLGGAVGASGVSGGVSAHTRTNEESSVEFLLDTAWKDYSEIRNAILSVHTQTELNAVADTYGKTHPGLIQRRIGFKEDSTGLNTSFGILGKDLVIGQDATIGRGVEQNPDGRLTNTVTASNTLGASFSGFGTSNKDSVSGRSTDDNKGEGVAQSERTETDISKSAQTLYEQASAHPLATVIAVFSGERELLQKRVDTKGIIFGDAAIANIAKLAEDKQQWMSAWKSHIKVASSMLEWEATGEKIRQAQGNRQLILSALAEWEHGGSGRSVDIESIAGKEGVPFQFADENANQRGTYETLVVHDPLVEIRQMEKHEGKDRAVGELRIDLDKLGALADSIQQYSGSTNPRQLEDMQRRIYDRTRSVRAEIKRLTGTEVKQASPAQNAPQVDRAELGQRVRELTKLCLTNQDKERAIFTRVREKMEGWASARNEALPQLRSIESIYAEWDRHIEEIKSLRTQLGLSPEFALSLAPDRAKWQEFKDTLDRRAYGVR